MSLRRSNPQHGDGDCFLKTCNDGSNIYSSTKSCDYNNHMTDLVDSIRERYLHTLDQITVSAQRVSRNPNEIRLVVVTKTQLLEVVQAALEAGVKLLGENYPEEGVMKIQSLPKQSGVEWHMIGHVQSRKARLVPEHFALLHSLDGVKLAQRLAMFAAEQNRILPVLLEFNVGGEASKSGWNVMDDSQLDQTFPEIEAISDLPNQIGRASCRERV